MGVILGIDPGFHGGLAAFSNEDSGEMTTWVTPTTLVGKARKPVFDEVAMARLLTATDGQFAVIERVHAMPRQGVTSMFRFGEGFGLWRGLLVGLGIPYFAVTPQVWKKALFPTTGLDHRGQKQAAIDFVHQSYPGVELVPPRCRVAHDGMADAACLAHYGYILTRN